MSEKSPNLRGENFSVSISNSETLTGSQIAAKKFANKLGQEIQTTIPEIKEAFLNGLALMEIVERFGIQNRFGITNEGTAREAVRDALKGYQNDKGYEGLISYPGLIEPEIWERISKEHKTAGSQKVGTRMREEGRGFFAMTEEQRIEVGKRSGQALLEKGLGIHKQTFEDKQELGRRNRDAGIGIFAQSPEELRTARIAGARSQIKNRVGIHSQTPEERKNLGNKAAISRGEIPFSEEEVEFIKGLTLLPEYQRGKLTDMNKIAQAVNQKFHDGKLVRRNKTIIAKLRNLKKKPKTN